MPNKKNNKKNTENMREEYGFGYDLSPDDFDVIGQNDAAKKNNTNSKKNKQTEGNQPFNPS
ncbi:hypothetical protein CSV80_08305 [Sporosarcina sp. P12(2017)]|uniref:hypothetical protein n=1 Tax=unclassified Sporosarcina TaxID=2647733 RepID=UPI000C16B380|nr:MULTISPECIES: hypothetical protein [unclassified Sporosarcina]PIC57579.1 hypothetical protein CSV81_08630 [Sporosarcina sp. P10]PIC60962.1 hypothetical protein CSV80_08305 [Sporosarcina sp. P12(2017)]